MTAEGFLCNKKADNGSRKPCFYIVFPLFLAQNGVKSACFTRYFFFVCFFSINSVSLICVIFAQFFQLRSYLYLLRREQVGINIKCG